MKLSEQWLQEWVKPAMPTKEWLEQLTLAGHEIEAYLPVADEFSHVVVGQIKTVTKHPDAKRLNVCSVDVGQGELLNIVCGGINLKDGLKVPVARVGAVLPGGLEIKETELRGVLSQGMICASTELGLGDCTQGHIMVLATEAPLGMTLFDYLELNDRQIEVAITPNRGDCLSVRGLARELAAITSTPMQTSPTNVMPANIDASLNITLQAPKDCPRYVGRVLKGVNVKITSPVWLTERLRRSGIRSIDPVVDVTNYVMMELGQPMHAFDCAQIKGKKVTVRLAQAGETITLLDETELRCEPTDLVIADDKSLLALAGVMGAKHSAINYETHDVLLESAYFDPQTIAKTLRRTGLNSESSHRFERGIDNTTQIEAIERATELLLEIVGGEAGPVIEVIDKEFFAKPATITLRYNRIEKILGLALPSDKVVTILNQLNCELDNIERGWQVNVPSYRNDLSQEIDLIEEVARLIGLEQIPTTPLVAEVTTQALSDDITKPSGIWQLQQALCQRGYREAITYSFVSPGLQQVLCANEEALQLVNPISADFAAMRVSLWPGLIQAVQYNQHRQQMRVRLFEQGMCFNLKDDSIQQNTRLAGIHARNFWPEQWSESTRQVDFFDMKADVLALFDQEVDQLQFTACSHPCLHPNQSAQIEQEGKVIGLVGMLHPALKQQLKFEGAIGLFELNLSSLLKTKTPQYTPISKYPAIRRDIAVVVEDSVSADALLNIIRIKTADVLQECFVFDVYQGQGIVPGKKSVAMGLILQEASRTLLDEEVEALMAAIIERMQREYRAELRE